MKNFFKNKPKKEIATLIVVIVIILFDIFMVYKFVYYKNLSANSESSIDLSNTSSFDNNQYQDEMDLFLDGQEEEFDLNSEVVE